MLQDPSTDGRAAWQRQNGASEQLADLLDFCLVICRLLCFCRTIFFFFCQVNIGVMVLQKKKKKNQPPLGKSDSIFPIIYGRMNSPFCPSAAATAFTLCGSRVTERGTKGLIQLYYLSFSGGQVARAALCATDFFYYFFSLHRSSSFLPAHLSCHLSTSGSICRL